VKIIGGLVGVCVGIALGIWLDIPNDEVRYAMMAGFGAIGAFIGAMMSKKKP